VLSRGKKITGENNGNEGPTEQQPPRVFHNASRSPDEKKTLRGIKTVDRQKRKVGKGVWGEGETWKEAARGPGKWSTPHVFPNLRPGGGKTVRSEGEKRRVLAKNNRGGRW